MMEDYIPRLHSDEQPAQALRTLGRLLAARGQRFEIVVVGGAALWLQGIIDRATRDVDVVAIIEASTLTTIDALPTELAVAVEDVARQYGIEPDWINAGPADLARDPGLPAGFLDRSTPVVTDGLVLHLAGRLDQIHLKFYAAADQMPANSRHLQDLVALQPTRQELRDAAEWAARHDPSDGFTVLAAALLGRLGGEDDGG